MYRSISLTRNMNINTVKSFNYAYNNNLQGLKNCIENGFNLNTKNADGNTVLHISSRKGNFDVVRMLINEFYHLILINQKNYQRKTAFALACENGHLNIVRILCVIPELEINTVDLAGYIPILKTYQIGHLNVLQYLIKYTHANYNFSKGIENIPYRVINFLLMSNITYSRLPKRPNWNIQNLNTNRSIPIVTMRLYPTSPITRNQKFPKHFIDDYMNMLVELEKSCPVCWEKFEKEKIKITEKCFHNFCKNCFEKITSKCPICRQDL